MKRKIWKIVQLNAYIRGLLDNDGLVRDIFIEGELSNVKPHHAGHMYFTLKDGKSAINCVMFSSYTESLTFAPQSGVKVIARGYASVFEKTGQLQFYAEMMELSGVGGVYAAFEALKSKLAAEGLFDASRKKPLPAFPKRIAVVTSETGAVVHDIINVTARRNPFVGILVVPVAVQGDSAPDEIAEAIGIVNNRNLVDVMIIGRGGGSAEDLWAFNTEIAARAAAGSQIPIISAVGHETDFTMMDMAADLRAPTPSAAAELAVPKADDVISALLAPLDAMERALSAKINYRANRLNGVVNRKAFKDPNFPVWTRRNDLNRAARTLNREAEQRLGAAAARLGSADRAVSGFSPASVIARGYAVVSHEDGGAAISAASFEKGERFNVKFKDGSVSAVAETVFINE
jgi:exodeoxyribonuclease VII large subunit